MANKMIKSRPGFNPVRMARLSREAHLVVLTDEAT